MSTNDRLRTAVVAAQEAFWAEIAGAFPEIKTGDFCPSAQLAFDEACTTAAATWVHNNQPDQEGVR
jgi:hypothetical protein